MLCNELNTDVKCYDIGFYPLSRAYLHVRSERLKDSKFEPLVGKDK